MVEEEEEEWNGMEWKSCFGLKEGRGKENG